MMSRQLLSIRFSACFERLRQSVVGELKSGSRTSRSLSTVPHQGFVLPKKLLGQTPCSGCLPTAGARAACKSCGQRLLFSSYTGSNSIGYPLPQSVTSPRRRYDDPISQRLAAARTSEEILEIFEADADQMDALCLSVAVDALFDTLKTESSLSTKAKHQLLTSVGMQKLCKQLRRRSPHMDPGDIINCLKVLSFLSAPGSHQTLQILLKLLTKHANLMDLQQLVYTQFLLDKLNPESKSPLSKALEFALPVVFESKLQTDLDRNDSRAICDYLHYSSKYQLSEKVINFLVEAALRVTDRLSATDAKSILWSLCDAKCENPSHAPLISWCYNKLSESIDELSLQDLSTTVGKAARKYSRRAPYFYHENFTDTYCQKMMQLNVDPKETLWSIKNISIFRHLNIEYIDRIGEIIVSNPSHILNNDYLFEIFLKAISGFNYKPEKWSAFSSILLEHPVLTKSLKVHEVGLAIDFLALGMFPETLIRTLFSSDGLDLLDEFQSRHHPIHLVVLYNSVKVLYPKYMGSFPPVSMIENWKELVRASNKNKQYPLKTTLQRGLGGESYVINGLYHDGLHIDHGIVMRKGGYPVAVNSQIDSQSDCLSSISKPDGSIIVLIKVFSGDLYATNTKRLRGLPALELKILESLGHPVVAVDQDQWTDLPDHEKIPYLMQKIREKMEPLQWNQNWGDVIPP